MRKGDRALYHWIYPNFMINWYDGVMDTNLVVPRGVDQTEVIFDFYFPDVASEEARQRNLASVAVGQRIQDEDVAICKSVQRGLNSRAYNTGRLSVRREAGEHLFHRLLHAGAVRGQSRGVQNIGESQTESVQTLRVHLDLQLAHLTSEHAALSHAGHRENSRLKREVRL